MPLLITAIEEVGFDRKARLLTFATTETMRTAAPVVRVLGLEVGGDVGSLRRLRERVDAAEAEQARERALRILNARDKTLQEMLVRLQQDGYGSKIVQQVVDRLVEVGLIDDQRYAELYLSSAQTARKGWGRIMRELQRKGIDTTSLEPPEASEEVLRARAVIVRLPLAPGKERERALRRLVTKGYPYGIALQALEQEAQEREESEESGSEFDTI